MTKLYYRATVLSFTFIKNKVVMLITLKQLVIATYQPWVAQWAGNMHYKEMIILMDAMTDDSDIRLNGADRIQPRNWDFLPNSTVMADWWRYPYQSINAANYAIETIPSLLEQGYSQEAINPLIAEARFIRGYDYLYLVTLYGEVPLITKTLSSFEEFSQPRASIQAIYEQILSDFSFAKENLTDDGGGYEGTPTKATGAAFLAKAYLYKRDFQQAEIAARDAIQIAEANGYGLVDDFAAIFDVDNEANKELLFYFSFARNDANYSTTMSVERNIRDLPGELQHIQGGEGWGYALPTGDLYYAFEEDDPRRGYTVLAPGDVFGLYNRTEPFTYNRADYNEECDLITWVETYEAGDTVLYDMQWSRTGLSPKKLTENLAGLTDVRYGGLDVPIMRMGDLYLILAEALAEQGNSEALLWVNKVRARVGLPGKTTIDGSLIDIVRHERRVELALEGQRLFDLMRWNNVKQVLGGGDAKLHVYSDCLEPSSSNRFINPTGLSKYPTDNVLLPIPQFEIDQNSEINSNNPGY
jgi:hypothetical protein